MGVLLADLVFIHEVIYKQTNVFLTVTKGNPDLIGPNKLINWGFIQFFFYLTTI